MSDWSVVTAQLEPIGIDEISYRKGQRYLTVVVDHHSGRLVWAAALIALAMLEHGGLCPPRPARCRPLQVAT